MSRSQTLMRRDQWRDGKTKVVSVSDRYETGSTADDATIWANSFYTPAPTGTPAGTTRLTWIALPTTAAPRNSVGTTSADRFATGFVTGKGELLPIPQPARDANINLKQNPGY